MNQEKSMTTHWKWMKESVERCQSMIEKEGQPMLLQLNKEWQWFMDQWSQKQEVKDALRWNKDQDLSQEKVQRKINLWMNKGLQMWGMVWSEVSWCQTNFYNSYLWANAVKNFLLESGIWEGWKIWIFSGIGGWLEEWKRTWSTWTPESDQWQKCIMTIKDERVLRDVKYIWTQSGFIKQALKLTRSLGSLQFKKENEHDVLSGISKIMKSDQINAAQKEDWLDFLMNYCKVHSYWISRGMMYQNGHFEEMSACIEIWKKKVWPKIKDESCLISPKQKKQEKLDWIQKTGKVRLLPLLVESGWIVHVLNEPEVLRWDWSLKVGFRRYNLWAWSMECWAEENKDWTQWIHQHHAHWVENRQGVILSLAMKQKEMLRLLDKVVEKQLKGQRGIPFWIESIECGLTYQNTQSINALINAKNSLNPFASIPPLGIRLLNATSVSGSIREAEVHFMKYILEWVEDQMKDMSLKKKQWHWGALLQWCEKKEKSAFHLGECVNECRSWCALQEKNELECEIKSEGGEIKSKKLRL